MGLDHHNPNNMNKGKYFTQKKKQATFRFDSKTIPNEEDTFHFLLRILLPF